MAIFLTTASVASSIEDIIRKASSHLVLVTPFLKLNRHLIERLQDAERRKVQMTIIYGKEELAQNQLKILTKLNNLELLYCENLHAKCYYNENIMVISSMNLYEFSEKNNREMGVLIHKEEDSALFSDALEETISIRNASVIRKEKLFIPEIYKPYNQKRNFHLPLLKQMLNAEYPEMDFSLTEYELTANFVETNTILVIDYRMIIKFSSQENCRRCKNNSLGNIFLETKHKWYEKSLYFYYPESPDSLQINEEMQFLISKYFMDYLNKIWIHM